MPEAEKVDVSKFKWDEDSSNKALAMWNARDTSRNPQDVAADIAAEVIGSADKARRVISKLTHLKVYEKPKSEKKSAEKQPVLLKQDVAEAIKSETGFELGTLNRGNLEDIVRLCEAMGVETPEAKVR